MTPPTIADALLVAYIICLIVLVRIAGVLRHVSRDLQQQVDERRRAHEDELRRVRVDLVKQLEVQRRVQAHGVNRSIGASRN